jgi:hypothetical protein
MKYLTILLLVISLNYNAQSLAYQIETSTLNDLKFYKKITKKNINIDAYLKDLNFIKIDSLKNNDYNNDSISWYQNNANVMVIHYIDCKDSATRFIDYFYYCYDNDIHHNLPGGLDQNHLNNINYRRYRITKQDEYNIAYLFVPHGREMFDGKR